MTQIVKRSGKRQNLKDYKIQQALEHAYESSGETYNPEVYVRVLNWIKSQTDDVIPVEKIQDITESELMRAGNFETAKAFIKYRFLRKLQREHLGELSTGTTLVDCTKTIEEYIGGSDWRIKANANTIYSNAGLVNNTAGKIIANYWLDQVYSPEEGAAHRNGDYHIHDLDSLTGYCAGWSLRALLDEGFNGVRSRVNSRPPRHFRECLGQMANFLGILQSEWAGAQAFSSFDTYLAPYLFRDGLSFKSVKKAIRNFVYNLNVPSRWGQSPFTNVTIDWTVPRDLREQVPTSSGQHIFLNDTDEKLIAKAKERGVEKLTDLTYKHFLPEMKVIQKAFYEILTEGDSTCQPFTFPIPTVNITEDFDWEDENVPLLFENAAKIGSSYFQNFVGSQYKIDENGNRVPDEDSYKPDAVRSMCCRLQLDLRELLKRGGGLFGSAEMTGSIGVVTINMARLGYLYKGNKELLFAKFKELMDMAKSTLEKKRRVVNTLFERGLYPYTKRYLPGFNNHFSTIGVNGINEMLLNFSGGKLSTANEEGIQFSKELLEFASNNLKGYQEETGNLYNLEATPAEGCFSGDTTVWTDKGFKKIQELVGKTDVRVFTLNEETGQYELKDVESIYMTSSKAQVMRITLDNGRKITCTLTHPFAVRGFGGSVSINGVRHGMGEFYEWKDATNLKVGDRLKSIYLGEKDTGHVVFCGGHEKVHRIVANYKYGEIPEDHVVHHINENKWDNSVENIELMTSSDHKALHLRKQQEKGLMKAGHGEDNPFYGKHHSVESKMNISSSKAYYTEDQRSQMNDAYVNGHLSFAQIGRLLELDRIQVKTCIRTQQRAGIIQVDHSTCAYWQFDKTAVEYLKNLGKSKDEIIQLLGGSARTKELTSEYYDFLEVENHVITEIEYLDETIPVYNMTVKDNHNYYVSNSEDATDAVLVHNCTHRFAREDLKRFPDIIQAGTEGHHYYTNSSQLPVNYTQDLFKALKMQDKLQCCYTGGTVFHMYMSEAISSPEACKNIVKKVLYNFKMPYITVTPVFSVCNKHGYLKGRHDHCPLCDEELIEKYKNN